MVNTEIKALRSSRPADEFTGVELADKRLAARARRTVETIARAPGASLPHLAASDSELAGMYRFFNNKSVLPQKLLEPHFLATATRAIAAKDVLAIHDTTEVSFEGQRSGLGRVGDKQQGFLAHTTLVVAAGEEPLPLGVIALEQLLRPKAKKPKKSHRSILDPDNEFSRWERGIASAERRLDGASVIHVMDREGDSYELLALMVERQQRFVVRLTHNRRLVEGSVASHLFDAVVDLPVLAQRKAALNRRGKPGAPPAMKRKHPPRADRAARLTISATTVAFQRPQGTKVRWPKSLTVNVVHVREPAPPGEEPPVEWLIVTSEPIDTRADVLRIVDWYRRRWLIEEFFKALKTGCLVERRDFVEGHALMNVFALSIPIAWHMLLIRALSRHDPGADAAKLFSAVTLEVLHRATRRLPPVQRPPRSPSVRQALLAIAALGGHLKRNGDPGWLTLARGYQSLLLVERGFRLAADPRPRRARGDV